MKIAPVVFIYAHAQGIGAALLQDMVERSVRCSEQPGANRRYHSWMFSVVGDTVMQMMPKTFTAALRAETLPSHLRPGYFIAHETCDACEGAGCPDCAGEVTVQHMRKVV